MSGKSGPIKFDLELRIANHLSILGLLDRLDAEPCPWPGREARAKNRATTQRLLDECRAELAKMEGCS